MFDILFLSLEDTALPTRGHFLTHCILVDSPTVIYWMSPFVILGMSGLFCCFYYNFDGNTVSKQCRS